ncbi:winged helix-turn-helix domain-containing protein [Shewanella denitrificans]|nr:winged helix-turn-helix domain-containing protein [Shewanella denitrificans]
MNSKFIIGRYIYCTQERFLYLDGEPINIEPKMADVLDYLLLNTERYVPLQELHDEVWAGRIVTDTAVRRVVSRLRSLIEVDPSKPEIIKSLPKRGYRLFSMPANADVLVKTFPQQVSTIRGQDEYQQGEGQTTISIVDPSKVEESVQAETEVKSEAITEQVVADRIEALVDEQIKKSVEQLNQNALLTELANSGAQTESTSTLSTAIKYVGLLLLLLFTGLAIFYVNQPAKLEPAVEKLFTAAKEVERSQVQSTQAQTKAQLVHLDSLPLSTRMITLSQNGELALYEKQLSSGVFELYLYQINRGKQWLIARNNISSSYGVFVENDQALLLSFNSGSRTAGSVQLWRLDDANMVSSKQVFIDNIQGATAVMRGDKPNSAYVSLTSQVNSKSKSEFHYLVWNDNKLIKQKQITLSNNGLSLDIYGALSPNKQYLAYVRMTRLDHEQELQVLELASGKVVKRLPWPQEVRGLVWEDADNLLVLNKQNLTRLNLKSASKTELLVHFYGKFWGLYLVQNKIMLYQREPLNHSYIEAVIVDGKVRSMQRERPPTSVEIDISKQNSQQWFEVTKVGTQYFLDLIDLEDPEKGARLFSSDEYFYMLDESATGELLLRVGDRVGILKIDGSIDYINSEQQIVDDAVFDRDGINILYSEIINNNWSISRYDRNTQSAKLIREGMMSVRVSDEYYLFWGDNGQLFKAPTLTGDLETLPVKGNHFFSPIWGMAYPNVVWLDYISSKKMITQFNLISEETTVLETDIIQQLGFSLSHDGKTVVLEGISDVTSKLYLVENKH